MNGDRWAGAYCKRCGQLYDDCVHINTRDVASEINYEHAQRIRLRYEFGKRFDPWNHDTNSYTDPK